MELAPLDRSSEPLTDEISEPPRPESTATKPGATTLPVASMIRAVAGGAMTPTETTRPFWITTVPFSMTEVPVSTRPPVMAVSSCASDGEASVASDTAPRMRFLRRISGLPAGRWRR
jgi:hypothetical protein